ncbi:MAG: hypothetical protein KKA79_09245 [Nanoarchaeota archaeon]|nr:hypothetical protein [Nanoarchaeota archaeon]MCG2718544.1 hypothetical protein [Nanoarchaeota archaeon]
MGIKKTFLIIMLVAIGIGAVIGGYELLFGEFNDTTIKVMLTTLIIGGYSLTCLSCAALHEKGEYPGVTITGMVASGLAFLTAFMLIWGWFEIEDDLAWKSFFITMIAAGSLAQLSMILNLTMGKLNNLVKGFKTGTIISIGIVAGMLILFIMFPDSFTNLEKTNPGFLEYYFRILGFIAILDAMVGTLGTLILKKVTKQE